MMWTNRVVISVLVAATLCGNCFVNSQAVSQNVLRMVSDLEDNHLDSTLRQILRPRVVNSTGHEYVKSFIISELESLGMTVQLDEFRNATPFGEMLFTNVVGRLNPNADKFLTLACHYDSKYFAEFEFLAATDSAVPCAIMLNLARTLKPALNDASLRNNKEVSLQLLFIDGEEAFLEWTNDDSLYGSRHLAEKWANTQWRDSNGRIGTELGRIDLFVLLDLIGAPGSRYYSLFSNTHTQYQKLHGIERSLSRIGRLRSNNYQFQRRELPNAAIDDDHKPFLERGVPILHLISLPFPEHWHKPGDNYENLDLPSIRSFNDVMRVYVYNYLTNKRS